MGEIIQIKSIIKWILKKWKLILVFVVICTIAGAGSGYLSYQKKITERDSMYQYTAFAKLQLKSLEMRANKDVQIVASLVSNDVFQSIAGNYTIDELNQLFMKKDNEIIANRDVAEMMRTHTEVEIDTDLQTTQISLTGYDLEQTQKVVDDIAQAIKNEKSNGEYEVVIVDEGYSILEPKQTITLKSSILKNTAMYFAVSFLGILFLLVIIYLFSNRMKSVQGLAAYDAVLLSTVPPIKNKKNSQEAYFKTKTKLRFFMNNSNHKAFHMMFANQFNANGQIDQIIDAFVKSGYHVLKIDDCKKTEQSIAYRDFSSQNHPADGLSTVYLAEHPDELQKVVESLQFAEFINTQKQVFDYVFVFMGDMQDAFEGVAAQICDANILLVLQNISNHKTIESKITELQSLECQKIGIIYCGDL